jgi:hypothetical protein
VREGGKTVGFKIDIFNALFYKTHEKRKQKEAKGSKMKRKEAKGSERKTFGGGEPSNEQIFS